MWSMAQLWRTAAGRLLLAYLLLDLALFVFTGAAGAHYNAHYDLADQQIVSIALDAFLLWRIWRGGRIAWAVLLALTVFPLVLLVFGHTGSWSPYASALLLFVLAQTCVLLAPAVRHHVSQGQQVSGS
jgi:hypothetical protein